MGIALLAGLLSFLSPCVLPMIPAYLMVVSGASLAELKGEGEAAPEAGGLRRRVMINSLAFVAGFTLVFILLGASATFAGRFLSNLRVDFFGLPIGIQQIAGVVIVLMGLHVAGWLPIKALYRVWQIDIAPRSVSFWGALVVGAGFAFGWSPCIGPILGTILALAAEQETVLRGVELLSAYSAGLAIPFLVSSWSAELLLGLMARMRRHFHKLEIASGLLLIAIGLAITTGYWAQLNDVASSGLSGVTEWVLDVEDQLVK
jgi:cytochrome c-type biogenesis protein